MAHKKCYFLFDYASEDNSPNILQDGYCTLERYENEHFDGETWSRPLLLVCKNGHTECLDDEISEEEEALIMEHWKSIPEQERLTAVITESLVKIGEDMGFLGDGRGVPPNASPGDLLNIINHEACSRLVKAYTDLSRDFSFKGQSEWERRNLATIYEFFRGSLESRHPPFSYVGAPCEYRAFDLRTHGNPDKIGVLVVDIHT